MLKASWLQVPSLVISVTGDCAGEDGDDGGGENGDDGVGDDNSTDDT